MGGGVVNGCHFCSLLIVMSVSYSGSVRCHGSFCASLLNAAVQAAMCGGARLPGAPPLVQEMAAALCVCWPWAWQLTLTKHPKNLLDIYSAALFNKNSCCRRRRLVSVSLPQRSASAGSPPLPSCRCRLVSCRSALRLLASLCPRCRCCRRLVSSVSSLLSSKDRRVCCVRLTHR